VPSALPFAPLTGLPFHYTVHHVHDARLAVLYRRSRAALVAVSERQRRLSPELAGARVIHHGLTPDRYPLGDGSGGYAAFLGRLSREKGPHHALDAALAAGVPLKLAGRAHWHDEDYFANQVAPRLRRGRAQLVGELAGVAKARLLRAARALLFPIEWEEPFGLVMIESMLSGTPVLAFERGSVREVVDEGVTGFVCGDVEEMASHLRRLAGGDFDRRRCAERARLRFGARRMVSEYVECYAELVSPRCGDGQRVAPLA
jgi:glycosyltransferase involved in cell wall biosynthesis